MSQRLPTTLDIGTTWGNRPLELIRVDEADFVIERMIISAEASAPWSGG
ncbi:MAG TPA: hypothetical protein VLA83_00610 [Candidatus Binatia bacterium]|nr:hypothetical protein [Candidatus Binatia bacterium]